MGDGDAMKRGAGQCAANAPISDASQRILSPPAALCGSHNETPFLSVIVPVRNECGFIGHALDSILTGDYPADRMEVIVADGMSTDGTRERVTEYSIRDSRVRMIDNPARITPTALNLAIEASVGEIIARVDAHATVARDYLSRSVHYLESTGADNVGGPMRTLPQSSGPFSGAIVAALSHRFGVGNSYFRVASGEAQRKARWVDTVFGGCWRREVFERVGRFNEDLERSQDMEFSLRLKAAGGRTLLAPNVRSEYYARSDLRSFLRHNFVNGEWAVLPFLYSEVVPVSMRHLVPLVFVMTLALGAVLARGATLFLAAALPHGAAGSAWTAWPLAMVVVPYVVLNLAASAQVAWRERKLSFLGTMPMVFTTLHVSYGLGSACGLVQIVSQMIRKRLARRTIAADKHGDGRNETIARETRERRAGELTTVALNRMVAPHTNVAGGPVEEIACLPRN
jgi:succinoglycan biosynthesis protein ExoA